MAKYKNEKGRQDRIAETLTLNESFMKDPFQNPSRQHIENNVLCKYEGFEGFPGVFYFNRFYDNSNPSASFNFSRFGFFLLIIWKRSTWL